MNNFRLLRADEIDCRIAQIKDNGLSLLLYKDARCDMNILDETVGPMNWQRRHVRENANCIVSIYDTEKGVWIEKEDTGTESNTEAQKGLASDSFKRACFNWGIGRELYTAPFIWINRQDCNIKESGKDRNGNPRFVCNDRFTVTSISYDDKGNITGLEIANEKTNKSVFTFGKGKYTTKSKEPAQRPTEPLLKQGPDGNYYCAECDSMICKLNLDGKVYLPHKVAERAMKKFGKQLCWDCQQRHESSTD